MNQQQQNDIYIDSNRRDYKWSDYARNCCNSVTDSVKNTRARSTNFVYVYQVTGA